MTNKDWDSDPANNDAGAEQDDCNHPSIEAIPGKRGAFKCRKCEKVFLL